MFAHLGALLKRLLGFTTKGSEYQLTDLAAELLEWASRQSPWQQDLLRRLAAAERLGISDYRHYADAAERTELARPAAWYREPEFDDGHEFSPLDATHLPASVAGGDPVRVTSILHLHGANDLAPGASLEFCPTGLTIIAGKNGSGKSGYSRILKQVAASRAPEKVLPNAFSPDIKPKAVVRYQVGGALPATDLTWEYDTEQVESPLQRVRVFDARSASTQVAERNPVAYVPASLQILSEYTLALQEVAALIEADAQKEQLREQSFTALEHPVGREIHESLGTQRALDGLKRLDPLTAEEELELAGMPAKLLELTAANPAAVAAQARQRATQLNSLAHDLEVVATKLTPDGIETSRRLRSDMEASKMEVERTRSVFTDANVLPGTGNEPWERMWHAAREFSEGDCRQHGFPTDLAVCPFCAQILDREARDRMKLFETFMSGEAQKRAALARELRNADEVALTQLPIDSASAPDHVALVEVYDEDLARQLTEWMGDAALLRDSLLTQLEGDDANASNACALGATLEEEMNGTQRASASGNRPDEGVRTSPATLDSALRGAALVLRGFASTEETAAAALAATDSSALAVAELTARRELLTARKKIVDDREAIGAQHDRVIKLERLKVARASCNSTSASNTNSRLSQSYVAKVCQQFEAEVASLGLDRVPVQLAFDRSTRGVSYIRVTLKDAQKTPVASVLSEGEQRITAIAGFFADLTESGDASTLVFDDPVSSLDQQYRVKVAQRLLREAESRQVLVFTHDFAFVQYLYEEKKTDDTRRSAEGAPAVADLNYLHITRSIDGAGVLTGAEVWRHVSVKERLGRLSDRCQSAGVLYRNGDMQAYEKDARDIAGAIRETWEAFVEQELLNGVLTRHGRSIQTQRLSKLTDITSQDLAAVDLGMSVESRYMTGHDAPICDGSGPQNPQWLNAEVEALKAFRKTVLDRRK